MPRIKLMESANKDADSYGLAIIGGVNIITNTHKLNILAMGAFIQVQQLLEFKRPLSDVVILIILHAHN
jgi:hypothetical protein